MIADTNTLDTFTRSYLACALWLATDAEGNPSPDYDTEDIDPLTLEKMAADCATFQANNADDIAPDPSRAGHDFYLTRNRHGAGFWDGDWPEDAAKRLTAASHAWGTYELYDGGDGRLYGHG